ncbi:MAG: D-alanyl-D-alanine carboxypeptidase family protein [Simkaniaceae bacterium]
MDCGKIVYIFLLFAYSLWGKGLSVRVNAPYSVLINGDTKSVLYEKKAHEAVFPASTTKIATALWAIKKGKDQFDQEVKVPRSCLTMLPQEIKESRGYQIPPYWLEPDGTSYGLKGREVTSLRSLLYGLMLASGNDAANVIAMTLSKKIATFVKEMNLYVSLLGCENTHFTNPHGLHFPTHKTSAYDLGLMTSEALKEPLFCEIVQTLDYTCPFSNRCIKQPNRLLKKGRFFFEEALGVKTGYTSNAGYCFVAAAKKEGRTLIAVMLGCKENFDRYRDALALFDAAFSEPMKKRCLYNRQENNFETTIETRSIKVELSEDLFYEYYPAEEEELVRDIVWNDKKLPIRKGDCLGRLEVSVKGGRKICFAKLIAAEDIEKPKSSRMYLFFIPFLIIPIFLKRVNPLR